MIRKLLVDKLAWNWQNFTYPLNKICKIAINAMFVRFLLWPACLAKIFDLLDFIFKIPGFLLFNYLELDNYQDMTSILSFLFVSVVFQRCNSIHTTKRIFYLDYFFALAKLPFDVDYCLRIPINFWYSFSVYPDTGTFEQKCIFVYFSSRSLFSFT